MILRCLSLFFLLCVHAGALAEFEININFPPAPAVSGNSIIEDSVVVRLQEDPRPGQRKGLVGAVDSSPAQEIFFPGGIPVENGIRFEPDLRFEEALNDEAPALVSGNFGVVFLNSGDLMASVPVEGSTGPFSQDVFALQVDAGFGSKIPGVSLASQFASQLLPADFGAGPQRVVAGYLRAGTRFNELTTTLITLTNPLLYETPNQIDVGGSQIVDFDSGLLFLSLNFKGLGDPVRTGYIFVWDSFGSVGDDNNELSVQARFADTSAAPVGDQWQVNTFTSGSQSGARVASSPNGFVVVWASVGSPGDDNSLTSIQARRYGIDGLPLGDQFQVNQATMGEQFQPAVAMASDGSFVVTWTDLPLTTSNVFARVYQPDGLPQGDQFQLNTEGGADSSEVAIAGNDVMIAWRRGALVEAVTSFVGVFADGFESP